MTTSNKLLPLQWLPEVINDSKRTNFHPGDMPQASESKRPAADKHNLADAPRRVRGFRFDVTMTPMFDPPASKMDRKLNAEFPPSDAREHLRVRRRTAPRRHAAAPPRCANETCDTSRTAICDTSPDPPQLYIPSAPQDRAAACRRGAVVFVQSSYLTFSTLK
jgi:hypothetical protein